MNIIHSKSIDFTSTSAYYTMFAKSIVFLLLVLGAQGFVLHQNSRRHLTVFAEETEYVEPSGAASPDDSDLKVVEDIDTIVREEIASTVENTPDPVDAIERHSTSVEETIIRLIQIGASTGRGEFASQSQKDQAAELISTLEMENPTPEPAKSPLMQGRWELLYSSTQLFRSSPFFMAGRAVCSTPEQAEQYDWFCDMHRKALAISTIGQVRQVVSGSRLVSEFEVSAGAVPFLSDFTPFSYSGGLPVSAAIPIDWRL